ncbi:RsmE family RNA methyltransferase [Alicyclobacillus acidiphilus]|uniref:RsmE family RNA methyltransferase n=1 Tax=Alicyclobacillus acidiphilus TaxID=182455 RepID=UPI00082BF474|nr:RsmE family RNA methyltransferase [Alicyclobacillus acidiphilus]
MLPRVFVEGVGAPGQLVRVEGEDGHHYARVLRVQPGEEIVIAMDNGPWLAAIERVSGSSVDVRLHAAYPPSEPRAPLVLVQGIAKGDKMESILQKGTEIGAISFVVYQAARSVAKLDGKVEVKLDRWRKIIREAAMQSQRDRVPTLTYARSSAALRAHLGELGVEQTLILDEDERTCGILEALRGYGDERATRALLVGPEGGWSDEERTEFAAFPNASHITLGRRILRTETAGLVGLSVTLAHFGDMGG